MYVSNSAQAQYTSIQKIGNATTVENDTTAMQLSDNQEAEGIKKYDFTNMTRGQLHETVNNLIKNGEMSLDESSSLVLMMGPKITVSGNSIDASDEKVDAFSLLKQSIAFNQSIGNTSGIIYDNKALSALERFQGKTSGINIVA
jgi:hypothetical protein